MKKALEIKPSNTADNTYIVYRNVYLKAVPYQQQVAFIKVTYWWSYRLEALLSLSSDEVQYLREQARKIAHIEDKQLFISMIWAKPKARKSSSVRAGFFSFYIDIYKKLLYNHGVII